MYALETLKKQIEIELEKVTGKKISKKNFSIPPEGKGDLAVNIAFEIAKEQKKNPKEIADEIAGKLSIKGMEVKTIGPYLNFFFDYSKFSEKVLQEAVEEDYSSSDFGKEKQVMIEFCGVNPNKPHHLGHFRNESLGQAIANLNKFIGFSVITTSIVNDKGVPVAKAMLGYEKWKKGEEPDCKPDHFIGKLYSDYEVEVEKNPELEKEVKEVVQKIQNGDKEALETWKKIWDWFFEGMQETHERENVHIDKFYLESEIQSSGKQLVLEGLEKGVFEKEDGAVIAPLEKYGLPNKVLLRSDGTAVYATTDIGMAKSRFEEYPNLEKNIYCVMNEQSTYFKQWMKAFELIYPEYNGKIYHLAYGMVKSKEGKKMASRKGSGVLADDFMNEMTEKASEKAKENNKELSDEEVKKIGEVVGLGALKFSMLSTESTKDIHFDIEKALSFEGDTGPYLQYAYARCNQILEKAGSGFEKAGSIGEVDYSALKERQEKELVKKLSEFPEVIIGTTQNYSTHSLVQYLLSLAHAYSSFYENCPVLKADDEIKAVRLQLVKATANVLKIGLKLLGIEVIERM